MLIQRTQDARRAAGILETLGKWEEAINLLGRKNRHGDVCRTLERYKASTGREHPSERPIYTLAVSSKRWAGHRARILRDTSNEKSVSKAKLEEALSFVPEADHVKIYQANGLTEEAAQWLVQQGQHKEAIELLLDSDLVLQAVQQAKGVPKVSQVLAMKCNFVEILESLKAKHGTMSKTALKAHRTCGNPVLDSASMLAKHNPAGFKAVNEAIVKLLDASKARNTNRTAFVTFYLRLIQAVFEGDESLLGLLNSLQNQRSSYDVVVQQVGLFLAQFVLYYRISVSLGGCHAVASPS